MLYLTLTLKAHQTINLSDFDFRSSGSNLHCCFANRNLIQMRPVLACKPTSMTNFETYKAKLKIRKQKWRAIIELKSQEKNNVFRRIKNC